MPFDQELAEEGRDVVVRIRRQHVRHVLVGADNDHCPLGAVDAAQVEDVGTVLQVG